MNEKTVVSKKKDSYDKTRTRRAEAHLERLEKGNGKRLPVDLSGPHVEQLGALMAAGYAPTAAGVIRKAIEEAYASLPRQDTSKT